MPFGGGGGGGGGATAPLTLTGTTDAIQLLVKALAGQTADLFDVEKSDGTTALSVNSNGTTSLKPLNLTHDVLQVLNSGGAAVVEVFNLGGVYIASAETSGNDVLFVDGGSLGASAPLITADRGGTRFQVGYKGDVAINGHADLAATAAILTVKDESGNTVLGTRNDGNVLIPRIPTADPGVAGAIYSLAGTLHVS